MAKKSKKKKKQQRKYHFVTEGAAATTSAIATPQLKPTEVKKESKVSAVVAAPTVSLNKKASADDELAVKTGLMLADARNTAIIGGVIILVLFVLWYLFEHTVLGPHVYQLIHLTS